MYTQYYQAVYPVSILHKYIAVHYRPVRVADGPKTARCRFLKNASWVLFSQMQKTCLQHVHGVHWKLYTKKNRQAKNGLNNSQFGMLYFVALIFYLLLEYEQSYHKLSHVTRKGSADFPSIVHAHARPFTCREATCRVL